MPVEILVPQLGESVVEATISRWLKKVGEIVAADEPVVELETDKVNVEVPAPAAGIFETPPYAEGDVVSVGDVIATLTDLTAEQASALKAAPAQATAAPVPAAPAPPPVVTAPVAIEAAKPGDIAASPLAKQLADENKIDLHQINGSGPGGKIVKDDVANYIERSAQAPATAVALTQTHAAPVAAPASVKPAAPAVVSTSTSGRPEERRKMSRRRQTIAARLVEAQHTAAMLTTFNEVDMSEVMAIRARYKESFKEKNGVGLGFMSFFTKATVGALKAFPLLNAEIQGTEILVKGYYDIGVAVSTEEGLVVPVVRDADKLTFAGIEKAIGDLAGRARANTLGLADLTGGTFTITNGGTFGSLMSTPILNAPQVGILGMHKIQDRPIAVKGAVVIKPMMYLALSYDHRIVDGSEAVRFLVRIKELIEDPEAMLLES